MSQILESVDRRPATAEASRLENLRVAVVTHALVSGPTYELVRYLQTRVQSLVCVFHPLQPFSPLAPQRSTCQRYSRGVLTGRRIGPRIRLPKSWVSELVCFAKDIFYTLTWCWPGRTPLDLYIGVDPLNAWVGVWLQRLGRVRRTIYYTIDYVPQRFPQRWLNTVYHAIDQWCVRSCDIVWNLSERMVDAREAQGVPPSYRARQLTVPIGTDEWVPPPAPAEPHTLVFFGGLMQKQGLQLAIEALPVLQAEFPDICLLILGGGIYEPDLRRLVEARGVGSAVRFWGVIEDHGAALAQIAQCALGVATYCETPDNFSQYTEPGKLKAYLTAGVPIIVTRVPEIAPRLAQAECAVVIPYDVGAFIQAVRDFFRHPERLAAFRVNALTVAARSRWTRVFAEALDQSWPPGASA